MKLGITLLPCLLMAICSSAVGGESYAELKERLRTRSVASEAVQPYEFLAEEIFSAQYWREDMPTYGPFTFEDTTSHHLETHFPIGGIGRFVVVFLPMSPPVVIDTYYTTYTRQGRYDSVTTLWHASAVEMLSSLR